MDHREAVKWFWMLERRSQSHITKACEQYRISFSEFVILFDLYEHEGINQEDLSEILLIDKAAAARSLKSLEEKGYVKRLPGQYDRRVKLVYSTDAGKKLQVFLLKVTADWIDFLSEGMDQKTLETVIDGIKKLADNTKRVGMGAKQICADARE